jgi:hypothetical protein
MHKIDACFLYRYIALINIEVFHEFDLLTPVDYLIKLQLGSTEGLAPLISVCISKLNQISIKDCRDIKSLKLHLKEAVKNFNLKIAVFLTIYNKHHALLLQLKKNENKSLQDTYLFHFMYVIATLF